MDNRPDFLVPATPALAAGLAGRLARDHAREVRELAGMAPEEALRISIAGSVEAYLAVDPREGEAFLAMGVGPRDALTGCATPWMLGTGTARQRGVKILRAARWGLARAFVVTDAALLVQFIPDWYRTGLNFAARMGFRLERFGLRSAGGSRLWRVSATAADAARILAGNNQRRKETSWEQ